MQRRSLLNWAMTDARAFLDHLSGSRPVPGGGGAAAYSGAMAAALTAMVARCTLGKKNYAAVEPDMQRIADRADVIRLQLEDAILRDGRAYEALVVAMRTAKTARTEHPPESPAVVEAAAAVEDATLRAATVPLEVMEAVAQVLPLTQEVAEKGLMGAVPEAGVGAQMARAASVSSALNARVNCRSLKDAAKASALLNTVAALEESTCRAVDAVMEVVLRRSRIDDHGNPVVTNGNHNNNTSNNTNSEGTTTSTTVPPPTATPVVPNTIAG